MGETHWNNGRLVGFEVNDPLDRLVHEGDARPRDDGEDGRSADAEQQPAHLSDGEGVEARVALREERMAVRVVPDRQRLVEGLAAHGKVDHLDDRVEEEEHCDCVRREVVHVVALHHQVDAHHAVLHQQQYERHLSIEHSNVLHFNFRKSHLVITLKQAVFYSIYYHRPS